MKPIAPENNVLQIEWWPIGSVSPYPGNARRISDAAIRKVARSIEEFGWKQPLVVRPDGTIIVGHTRLLAAERLQLEQVPVIVAQDLNDAEARAYRLADNRTGEETTWDFELLDIELKGLLGEISLDALGFDSLELVGLADRGPLGDPTGTDSSYDLVVTCESEGEAEACRELLEAYNYKVKSR